jgi:hypothetical protein
MRREIRLYDSVTFARLCRARDYLGDCYRDRVTLEKAAERAYLSPFHFNRLFAQAFGETPHEFVTRMRIEEAKRPGFLQRAIPFTDWSVAFGVSPGGTRGFRGTRGTLAALLHTRLLPAFCYWHAHRPRPGLKPQESRSIPSWHLDKITAKEEDSQ